MSHRYVVHLADQRRSRTDSHGIVNFSIGLTRALPAALGEDDRLVVLVNDELAPELGTDFLRSGDDVIVLPTWHTLPGRLWLDHHRVSVAAASADADAVLFPKGFLPLRPPPGNLRQVVCLHDDIPFLQRVDPALPRRRRVKARYFSAAIRRSMRTADRRLFVSEFSRAQLVRRVGPGRADDLVVHEGITVPRRPVQPLAERVRRAVVFGSRHPHKRVRAGIDLLASDPRCLAEVDHVLVLGPLPDDEVRASLRIEHRPDPLPADELARVVAESRLVLFPSEYEGFGLPPIEAYALGTPAVFRRNGAASELIPDVPGGYDLESDASFGAACAEALSIDDAGLQRWSQQMWNRFTWEPVAERVAASLRAAVESGDRPRA